MATRRTLIEILILLLVTMAAFAPALGGGFLLWDDPQHFWLNPHLVAQDYAFFWTNPYYGFFAPVIYSVWTFIYSFSTSPLPFHALNLILHAGNVVLIYFLAKKFLPTTKGSSAALIAALIFALHPVQTEPVAWISGGRDLLAAGLGLIATLLVLRTDVGYRVVATLIFALALLTKPALATWPLAMIVLDKMSRKTVGKAAGLYATLGVWLGLGALAMGTTLALQAPTEEPRLAGVSLFGRMAVAIDSLGFYLRMLAWPWPLSFNYDRQISEILAGHSYLWGILSITLAVLLIFAGQKKFGKIIYAGTATFVIMLLPVLGLVPFAGQVQSTVFDRYLYLPMFGAALIVGALSTPPRLRALLMVTIVVCAGFSFHRAGEWRNDRTLNESALDVDPGNYFALNNLAIHELKAKNLGTAESLLRKAWERRPKEALAPANLGHVLWLKNDVGAVLGEIWPLTETEVFLRYNQREPEALALIHRMTARALNATLDVDGARRAYERALAYRPDDGELRAEVGLFLRESAK